jgi:hypothetical protein
LKCQIKNNINFWNNNLVRNKTTQFEKKTESSDTCMDAPDFSILLFLWILYVSGVWEGGGTSVVVKKTERM